MVEADRETIPMTLLRNFATPLSFITFAGVGLTGILLLFDVRGPLGEVHEWLGVGFIVALALHLARNWRGVVAMLKIRTSKAVVVTLGAITAAAIVIAIPSGSDGGLHGGHGAGIVVHRIAQSPIAATAPALGLSGDEAVMKLRKAGVEVDGPQETLAAISRDHHQPLPRLFSVLLNET